MNKGFEGIFESDSVMKTLVLCVLTVGAYLIYKLYQFSKQINQYSALKISPRFMITTILLFAVSLVSLLYGFVNFHNLQILKYSIIIHLVSTVFDVTWIIMVRNRINMIAGANAGDTLWLNPYITSIFHVIYMQHKINLGLSTTRI